MRPAKSRRKTTSGISNSFKDKQRNCLKIRSKAINGNRTTDEINYHGPQHHI